MEFSTRYDAFQKEAVYNIVADFREESNGRFLLVIPTGGGKTTTAVKAVSAIFESGILGPDDRVIWLVHRDELRRQAQDSFSNYAGKSNQPDLPGRVDILMLSEIKSYLSEHPKARFAVIDEAHHVAAKSYQPLFERMGLGILGLTATPSRHDGQPLQFTRESYSIGFPDLVSMGVLLRPNVIRVEGGTYDISDISNDSEALEVLNNSERNARIVSALVAHIEILHKAIVYVGTKKHALDLYKLLKSSVLQKRYDSISIILGDERRRFISATGNEIAGETRRDFIEAQKSSGRSILVNVDVLTEGYDDPTVNAVVMARPTSSKLVYMQALGRAVRIDPNNPEKEAYVIEVTDNLPNIKYRIDNRWLYSDISDLLEPDVVDVFYASPEALRACIEETFASYSIRPEYRIIPDFTARDRVTMLLFKAYAGDGNYEHIPLVITNATRQAAAGFFNYLAARIKGLHGLDVEQVFRPVLAQAKRFAALELPSTRKHIFSAMENAWEFVRPDRGAVPPAIDAGRPWITFVAFRLEMSLDSLGADLLQFTEDMLNKETIRETLRTGSIGLDFFLVRFPQPLRGSWGVFMAPVEFSTLRSAIEQLEVHAAESDGVAQWQKAESVLGTSTIAVEHRHVQSLTTIARENFDYFRPVDQRSSRSQE